MNSRKLLFALKKGFKIQLSFTDHYGTAHLVSEKKSDILNIREDDEKTEQELLDYYDARYARFGLETKFHKDVEIDNAPENVSPDIESEAETKVEEDVERPEEPAPEVEHYVEPEQAELVESYTEEALEKLNFKQLSAICKEQNLVVDSRSKDACIKAILKAQGE